MKNKRWFLFLIALLFLGFYLNACSVKKTFYQKGNGWDYLRFPLLEPYYAIKISEKNGWVVSLNVEPAKRNFLHYLDIQDVRKIAVENGIITAYTPYPKPILMVDGQEKELHWFILIPDQAELGFGTEEEFNLRLQQYDINKLKWQEPLTILQTYDQTGCLDWIPGCK
jgi:hypothetical protein